MLAGQLEKLGLKRVGYEQDFMTAEEYLMQHGAYTPDGRRIVLYPHPVEGIDALSLFLYQLIDEAVEIGKLEFPELESDER